MEDENLAKGDRPSSLILNLFNRSAAASSASGYKKAVMASGHLHFASRRRVLETSVRYLIDLSATPF